MSPTGMNFDAPRSPDGPAIRLDQFLKRAGAVGSGGQAKVRIQGGDVRVNGEPETRRGRKLKPGDVVELDGNSMVVPLDERAG